MYGLRRVAVASGDNPCSSVWHIFPLIALINTDIPCIRGNPCSSVVGIIFLRETSFYGYILTTEFHWFTLNPGYVSRASVLICVHPWDIYSHWLHRSTLIFRVSVPIRARRWLVLSPTEWRLSAGYILTTELHWTTLNQEYLFALRSAQKSQLSKPSVSVLVGIV